MKIISNKALSKRDSENMTKGAIVGVICYAVVKKFILPRLKTLTVRLTPSVTATFDGPAASQQ